MKFLSLKECCPGKKISKRFSGFRKIHLCQESGSAGLGIATTTVDSPQQSQPCFPWDQFQLTEKGTKYKCTITSLKAYAPVFSLNQFSHRGLMCSLSPVPTGLCQNPKMPSDEWSKCSLPQASKVLCQNCHQMSGLSAPCHPLPKGLPNPKMPSDEWSKCSLPLAGKGLAKTKKLVSGLNTPVRQGY